MAARPPFTSSPESFSTSTPIASSPLIQSSAHHILDVLLNERAAIEPLRIAVPHLCALLDAEIARVSAAASDPNPSATFSSLTAALVRSTSVPNPLTNRHSPPTTPRNRVKIPVPADKYPEYNFVGRLLGPRGTTLKTLERDTACKIMIRGKGSIRKDKEPAIRGKPGWEHVFNEPLHVVIEVDDSRLDDNAAARALSRAKEAVESLLVPVPEERDGLKRQQLRALAIMNGTYRGGPGRTHDQLSVTSYANSPQPVHHPPSPYPVDPPATQAYLGDTITSPLSSSILPPITHSMDDKSHYRQRNTGRRSPSSGATSPNAYGTSVDNLSVLTTKMQHCTVDEFASSSVGDDSPESSHSSEEGEPSTHIIGNGYGAQQVKVSPISPGNGPDTSLSFGGFIGQEFYNGAFSNGAAFPNSWNQPTANQPQASIHLSTPSPAFSAGPYAFSSGPPHQVLTTSPSTVTPIDRQVGY